MSAPYVLSGLHVKPIQSARSGGCATARASLDLGLTTSEVALDAEGVTLPDGARLDWRTIDAIARQETACFTIDGGQAVKIARFSDVTNRACSLMATAGAPTLIVAGFTMHRIVGVDPAEDTRRKIAAAGGPPRGRVLDTCTGLGYTAIAAAQTADGVVTIELDPTVLEIARLNPWSRRLFDNPRITQVIGDAGEGVRDLPDGAFSLIIHDPPTFSLAGDLYAGAFYRDLFRVLQPGGRLFHYIGQVESKLSQSLARGVMRRLTEAGFKRVDRVPAAFGLLAYR
jgi:predicted methyltransferase